MSPPERAPVPVLDLNRYDADLKRDVARAVEEVFATGRFVLGPANAAFENALAAMLGIRHAVGVSSGTDALLVALMALRVGPGDEVVTSPFSFFASAGVVARLNAKPVFVDIEPGTFNMDPAKLEAAITPRTKAIQPVHLYGQCADMTPILEIAARRGIPVVEDACQAIGATYGGRAAGTMGAMGAFSFYPTKNLGAAGDAGAVATADDATAALLKSLRLHGSSATYFHDRVGRQLPPRRPAGGGSERQAAAPRGLERAPADDRAAVRRAAGRRRRARSGSCCRPRPPDAGTRTTSTSCASLTGTA